MSAGSSSSGSSNLGALEPLAAGGALDAPPPPLADPASLSPHFDAAAAIPSVLLLVLLLALSGNRILGLDRYWQRAAAWLVQRRRLAVREEVMAARAALERQFAQEVDGGGGSGSAGGGPRRGGGAD